MIDKVIKLKDESIYYVLDEIIHRDKRFVLCVECENYEIKNNYSILEILIDNNKLIAKNIDDTATFENIVNLFLSKLKNLNEDM